MLLACSSRPENNTRAYTIGTMFPNHMLDDDSLTIEAAGLTNSVIVQRWVRGDRSSVSVLNLYACT
jgi:hypothetical protein